MADWQPMETAPKDGTFVQLFDPIAEPPVSVGCWDEQAGVDGRPGWLIAEADFMPTICRPRCWAPLLPRPDIAPTANAESAVASDIVALIAKARRVEELEAALKAMLNATSEHDEWCAVGPIYSCTCDLHLANEQARAALKENTDATSD